MYMAAGRLMGFRPATCRLYYMAAVPVVVCVSVDLVPESSERQVMFTLEAIST